MGMDIGTRRFKEMMHTLVTEDNIDPKSACFAWKVYDTSNAMPNSAECKFGYEVKYAPML